MGNKGRIINDVHPMTVMKRAGKSVALTNNQFGIIVNALGDYYNSHIGIVDDGQLADIVQVIRNIAALSL